MSALPGLDNAMRGGGGATVRLADRFDIHYDKGLAEFRTPGAPAFAAIDIQATGDRYFAIICDSRQPIRLDAIDRLRSLKSKNILTPVAVGPVEWPPANRRCFALVFEQPVGGRLVAGAEAAFGQTWSEDHIISHVVAPLVLGLGELEREGLVHRGIRPDNIFFRDPIRRAAILGDCATAPPGLYQPTAYETIEGGLADRDARGARSLATDLYALGVLVLHLHFGRMPMGNLSDRDIVAEKIQRGSYHALVADGRVSQGIAELARGLLTDDAAARWRVQDVQLWLDGRRSPPKAAPPAPRAQRGFDIGGQSCATARHLALVLGRMDEDEASRIIRGQPFEIWLTRTLGDKAVVDGVSAAFAARADSGTGGPGQTSQLIARVLAALDPPSPIRYRGVAANIDGLGFALATAMLKGADYAVLTEIMQARLPQFWIMRQLSARPEDAGAGRNFERLRRILEDTRPGYGIERLVYEMVPGLPCLSPLIEKRFIDSPADMLAALEAAVKGGFDGSPVDRHIAAFLAFHEKAVDDQMLYTLVHQDISTRVLGTLQLLAHLQYNYGPPMVPALTALFGQQCKPSIERFRNRATRTRLQNGLAAVLRENSLKKLSAYLDNAEEAKRDAVRFHRARLDYEGTLNKLEKCDTAEAELQITARDAGHTIAVRVATLIGTVIAGFSLLAMGVL